MAKKFVFRLEVVRRLRDQARKVQQRMLAEAQRDVIEVEGRLAENEREFAESMDEERTAATQAVMDVGAVRRQLIHRGWLIRREAELSKEWNDRQEVVRREREKLVEAVKKLKVIAKLRERRWVMHMEHERRVERKDADETASLKFVGQAAGEALTG